MREESIYVALIIKYHSKQRVCLQSKHKIESAEQSVSKYNDMLNNSQKQTTYHNNNYIGRL